MSWLLVSSQGGRKDFFYTRSLEIEEKNQRVLWGPCPIKTADTLSVLILQHVSDSLVPLSSIN